MQKITATETACFGQGDKGKVVSAVEWVFGRLVDQSTNDSMSALLEALTSKSFFDE